MHAHRATSRGAAVGYVVAGLGCLVLIGVVMAADTHEPVAIEPDAARADGASVATFALG